MTRHLAIVLLLCVAISAFGQIPDTVPAAHFTVHGTAGDDTVTFSDGPGGTTTISAATFGSVTFANKTNVVFDGLGGDDEVIFANPHPATGLASLIVKNVNTIRQTAAIRYASIGLQSTGRISLQREDNDVDRLEVRAGDSIGFRDAGHLTIGGVSDALTGVDGDADVSIDVRTGNLTLSDADGAQVVRGMSVWLNCGGDFTIDVDRPAVLATAGSLHLRAGRDILLGASDRANDVRAASNAFVQAGRNITIAGRTTIVSGRPPGPSWLFGPSMEIIAGATFEQRDEATMIALGLEVMLTASRLMLIGDVPAAQSPEGVVDVDAHDVTIGPRSGLRAPRDSVYLRSPGLRIGSLTDVPGAPAELSDEELDRLDAPSVILLSGDLPLDVVGPVSTSARLTLFSSSELTSSGTARVQAPELKLAVGGDTRRSWTITDRFVELNGRGPVSLSGVSLLDIEGAFSSDDFDITPSATTRIRVGSRGPELGDSLAFRLNGVADPELHVRTSGAVHAPIAYTGSLTSSNRKPVEFGSIETFENAPVDVRVTNSDGAETVQAGERVTYTVTVHNAAPIPVLKANVVDLVPPGLADVRWTCVAFRDSNCSPLGRGDVRDVVNLGAGGSATYRISGIAAQSGTLTNVATVTTPDGYVEANAANNSATDVTNVVTGGSGRKGRAVRRR